MTTRKNKSNSPNLLAPRAAAGVMALAAAAVSASPSIARADDAPSKIHELVNLEFATEYVTPRGMIVHDQGLTFQPLALTLVNVYHGDTIINDVTLVGGCWNDFGTAGVSQRPPYGSPGKTMWTEIDPIGGVSMGITKYLKLDVTYSAFAEQILSIGTSQNLEVKATFDDSEFLGAFALHPYFSWWNELQGKATDADVPAAAHAGGYPIAPRPGASSPAPGPSYYFELGVDPGYTFTNGIKLEAPLRMTFPNQRFYGDYYSESSIVGIWEVGLKATLPMNFIPSGYGHWSFHAGYRFMYFVDDNLYQLNTFNAPGPNTRDTSQGYCGVSVFF